MNFVLNTQEEKKQMLSFLGMNSINDLFEDINEDIKQKELLKLPKPL
jgi:glycine cleavage system pyridoxal-binding protein P